jgi:hypothetical protein
VTDPAPEIAKAASLPHYPGWTALPAEPPLFTKTQLGSLDLPRVPSGPAVARVSGADGAGRTGVFDLYDATADSKPTRTGPAALLAADQSSHICEACWARPERPVAQRQGQKRRLCQACARVETIRAAQARARVTSARHTEWAREVIADPMAVWVYLEYAAFRPRSRFAGSRPGPAVTMTAVDFTGAWVLRMVVRLVPETHRDAPAKSVDERTAARRVAAKLGGRRIVLWSAEDAGLLSLWSKDGGIPIRFDPKDVLENRLPAWRAVVDPHGAPVGDCLSPGRADRLLVATARMAEITNAVEEHGEWLTSGGGAAIVDITTDPESAARLHAILRAVGAVLDDAEPQPVAVSGVEGLVRLRVLCHRDGVDPRR